MSNMLEPSRSCSSPMRPFTERGMWIEREANQINSALHFHTTPMYQPSTCNMLQRVINIPSKYMRGQARHDSAWTSRLVWTDGAGVTQRPFVVNEFLSRFRNKNIVLVGDSHCSVLLQSLIILVGCSQPQRTWPEVPQHGELSVVVPEYNVSIFRRGANILTPVTVQKRASSAPSFYIKDGKRVPMRAQNTTQIVRLDVPGLGKWADPQKFRDAGLVIMKQGAWANNFRSDVKVVTRSGVLGENATESDFISNVFTTGVSRAMAWFDEILPPTAMVVWMGSIKVAKQCGGVRTDVNCKSPGPHDKETRRALMARHTQWLGCGSDIAACAKTKPRQWLLETSGPSNCRPDMQHHCFGKWENGTVIDAHPGIPGMPDLWNAMLLDSILEDDIRCAAPSQLDGCVSRAAYYAALDRQSTGSAKKKPEEAPHKVSKSTGSAKKKPGEAPHKVSKSTGSTGQRPRWRWW